MRINQVKGIIHDLLYLDEDFSPINYIFLKEKLEVDLLNERINYLEEDDAYKFYKKKLFWFKERVANLKGDIKEFQEAKLIVYGHKEKISITYKNKKFEGEIVFSKTSVSGFTVKDWFSWRDKDYL